MYANFVHRALSNQTLDQIPFTMPLVVSPVLLPDLPAIQRLSLSVEADTATGSLLFPNGASETSIAHLVKQDEKDIRDPKCTCRHIIMRDVPEGTDTYGDDGKARGEIVSYAMWNFFIAREKANTEGQDEEGRVRDGAYYESWPPDAHHQALEVLVEMGRKKREGTMGQRNYACKYISMRLSMSDSTVSHR